MATPISKPVIFLAFANVRDGSVTYLRNLPEELRRIRAALEPARRAGLCDIVERMNTTMEEILDVFQHPEYRNRIAIFHYGGHANGYQLLLESSEGQKSPAYASGFAAFLGEQRGLQLVFLNGCSTKAQAQRLLDAEVKVVIATSQEIIDDIATELAVRFYAGLASSANIRTAFNEATAAIRTEIGDDWLSYYHGVALEEFRWPWDLYLNPAPEGSEQWNLPAAANDPLFGLPPIPSSDLPPKPYRHLNWFTRKHAEIFFGRGRQIQELYNLVTAPDSAPIILLYGQSGVGKSSLLEAGLMPRLESSHAIQYHRRQQEIGLLETLLKALGATEKMTLAQAWLALENASQKPVIVILDQIEEVYTRPNPDLPDELKKFLEALALAFTDSSKRPQGKLILGFRKEWLAELEKRLIDHELFHTKVFLERLDRQGIIEAITGPARVARLLQHYGLRVTDGLAEIIADDLLEDRDSPIAPTLQILLNKMWDEAVQQNRSQPHCSHDLYNNLKKRGILLQDFLNQQLETLRHWQPEIVDSGLALDVLAFHTTPLGSAEQRTAEHVTQEYRHCQDVLPKFLQNSKDLHLLVDPAADQPEAAVATATRLAHDTLAPLVRNQFDESDKPGQRGRRILENRSVEWRKGQQGTPLDERDLDVVEQGENGMRAWKPDEQRLIEASRKKRAQYQLRRKILRSAGITAVLLIFIFAGVAWLKSEREKYQHALALARQLAAQSELIRTKHADLLQRSLLLAVESMQRFAALGLHSLEADQALRHIMALLPRPLTHLAHTDSINGIALSRDGKYLAMAGVDHTAQIWEIHSGQEIGELKHDREVLAVAFSADGKFLATCGEDRTARVWEVGSWREVARLKHGAAVLQVAFNTNGNLLATASMDSTVWLWETSNEREVSYQKHNGNLSAIAFSSEGKYLVTASDDGIARILEITSGREIARLIHEGGVSDIAFSSDGKYLATACQNNTAHIFDIISHREVYSWRHEASVSTVAFSLDGKYLATACEDGIGFIWEMSSRQKVASIKHAQGIFAMAFSRDGKYLVSASSDRTARVWETSSGQEIVCIPHERGLLFADFMPEAKRVVTASWDGAAWFWETTNAREVARMTHDNEVRAVAFNHDGKYLATASWDRTARVWNTTTGEELARMKHGSFVMDVAFSPDDQFLATASFDKDTTARVWDINTGQVIAGMLDLHDMNVVAFSDDGKYLATAGDDSMVMIWDTTNYREVARMKHENSVRAVSFNSDGKHLATASDDTVKIWNISNGQEIMRLPNPNIVRDATFSMDGKYIATACEDRVAHIWRTQNGVEIARLHHDQPLWSVAFSADGKYLATASADHTARVWEIAMRQEIALLSHEGEVYAVAFSPDGRYLATASEDQTARVWLWQPKDLIREACSRLTRNLTPEEWQQYIGVMPYQKTYPDLQ
jgi:WD40 repeat protein